MSKISNTYIQYGISNEIANKLENLELPKTTFAITSDKNLRNKYGLSDEEITFIKSSIRRQPIDEEVSSDLLKNANFTCCVCKGTKSDSYIIHHIEHYSKSQDNSYVNLAVLCPNDHDHAHKEGKSLTNKLTPDQINNCKWDWEKEVKTKNAQKAAMRVDFQEIDFVNYPAILNLSKKILKGIPETTESSYLTFKSIITNTNEPNIEYISKISGKNVSNHPLRFFGGNGSLSLKDHYHQIFKEIAQTTEFEDLDDIIGSRNRLKGNVVGEYCYYVGGPYTKQVKGAEPYTQIHFKRKRIIVEWIADNKFFTSTSALVRANHRCSYLIYGKIMSVTPTDYKELLIKIRPYCFGMPTLTKYKTPDIAYHNFIDDLFEDDKDGEDIPF